MISTEAFLSDLNAVEEPKEVKPQLVKVYSYPDKGGNVLYEKLRYEPGKNGKKKDFRVRHSTADGKEWGIPEDLERVLYNLPAVLEADTVVLCEGEKDADTATSLGYVGTCIFDGASGKWLPEYTQVLIGKYVVMFRDQDEPGRKFSESVEGELKGRTASFIIVDVPTGKDLTDYIEAGYTREDVDKLIQSAREPKNSLVKKTADLIAKKPQVATECEKVILGVIIKGYEEIGEIAASIKPDDFSIEAHKIIYSCLLELAEEGVSKDNKALVQRLSDKNKLELVGGVYYILELTEDIPPAYNLDYHLKVITDKAQSRNLITAVMGSVESLLLGTDLSLVKSEINKAVESANSYAMVGKSGHAHDTSIMVPDDQVFTAESRGIATSLTTYNEWTDGMHEGEFIIIGARPGDGKTSLGSQFCMAAAIQGLRADIFAYEETKQRALNKIICTGAKIPFSRFRKGKEFLSELEVEAFLHARRMIAQVPLHIADTKEIGYWTTGDIRNYLKQQVAKKDPVRVLMIDYLELMRIPKADRHDIALGLITADLKKICNDFGITIILLSQLSRDGEKANRKPGKADLKNSGNIEADANTIIMPWQNRKENDDPSKYRDASLILPKAREGPTGEIKVKYWPQYTMFVDDNYFEIPANLSRYPHLKGA